MQNIVTVAEVEAACAGYENAHEAYVAVKQLGKFMVVNLGNETYEKSSKGDEVVAVCRDGFICTVMLRKSWSKSERYGTK